MTLLTSFNVRWSIRNPYAMSCDTMHSIQGGLISPTRKGCHSSYDHLGDVSVHVSMWAVVLVLVPINNPSIYDAL